MATINVRVLTTTGKVLSKTVERAQGSLSDQSWSVARQLTSEPIAAIQTHGEPIMDAADEARRSGCLCSCHPLHPREEAKAWAAAGLPYQWMYLPSSLPAPLPAQ